MGKSEPNSTAPTKERKFIWWRVYGWLGLLVSTGMFLSMLFPAINGGIRFTNEASRTTIIFVLSALIVFYLTIFYFVLRYNRIAFIIGTFLSMNLVLWLINGIYLKRRWNHPRFMDSRKPGQTVRTRQDPSF